MTRIAPPPNGITWDYARPTELEQCCWCGEPLLPGDYAMRCRQYPAIWSHYDSRPCYGSKPRPEHPAP